MVHVKRALLAYIAIAGLLLALAAPALIWLVRSWLADPYYSHGLLVAPLAAALAWRRWRRVAAEARAGEPWAGLAVTAASLAGVVWATRWHDYAPASLALLALAAGILLYLEGWPRLRHWLFPLFFVALAVPLPLVDRLSPWLESFTAGAATGLARLAGIEAAHRGGEIALAGTTLLVGAPCSGLRSLVAMAAVGTAWVYVVRGRPAARAIMLAAVLPLAVLANVLRIALLLAVAVTLGQGAALSYYHDLSSPVLFLIAVGLLLALGKVLRCSQIRDDIF